MAVPRTTYTIEALLTRLLPAARQLDESPWLFAEGLAKAGLQDPCVTIGLEGGDLSFTAQVDALDAMKATELVTMAVVAAASDTGLFSGYPGFDVVKIYPCELEEPDKGYRVLEPLAAAVGVVTALAS